ncbi:hypothetical protein [Parasitella parasitica]|uniref:Uncharacterized protein n=2 Tax=Parasitella parasitica TaxID=35722 RepID=A0A0B7N0G4_9FUNG|nr:hypothetical protein [Parasitella parasitica]
MIITDIIAAVLVYKVAYMLFPAPEAIYYEYEGVLRILLNYDLLLFVLLLSLAVGGDSTRYALGYAYLFVRRVVLLAWEWVILPCLANASRCCARLLWPTKGQVQPVAPVLLPASELMFPAPSSVASPPASSLLADALLPAGVLPAVASPPAAPIPFERPFLPPGAPATPHPVASCAACAELQASLVPAASDVPVAAPSSGWYFVSAAPVAPAVSVLSAASGGSSVVSAVSAASDVPVAAPSLVSSAFVASAASVSSASSVGSALPAAPAVSNAVLVVSAAAQDVSAAPSVTRAVAAPEDPPAPVLCASPVLCAAPVLPAASAVPVAVAAVPAPAPSISSGRGVRFVVSRRGDVARRAAVHAHKKVGKTTPLSELRRAARAALAAGVVKPASFCFPVVGAAAAAASSAVSCVGSWLLASARTVKVARKPARRIVSVRRLLRPAVCKEIKEQKAAIVVRRRVAAARRRAVAARLAVFARRAAAAVVAPPAPAFSSAGVAPSVRAFSSSGVAPGAAFSFAVPGPVCRPVVCRPPPSPLTPAVASSGVFRVPAVPCPVGRSEAVSAGGFAVPAPVLRAGASVSGRSGAAAASVFLVPAPVRWTPVSAVRPPVSLASLAARRPPAAPLSSGRVPRAGGADARPAGCTCPVVSAAGHPAAIARPLPCSCPAVSRVGCPPPVNGRPKTTTVFDGQRAAIARPAVAVFVRPDPKPATTRQASGSTLAVSSSSSSNVPSPQASRRIAIPRQRRRTGGQNT